MAPRSGRDDRRLEVIDSQIVLAEYGPMRMQIQAMEHGRPLIDLAMEGGRMAFGVLEDLARFLPVLKMKATGNRREGDLSRGGPEYDQSLQKNGGA